MNINTYWWHTVPNLSSRILELYKEIEDLVKEVQTARPDLSADDIRKHADYVSRGSHGGMITTLEKFRGHAQRGLRMPWEEEPTTFKTD